MLYPCDVSRRSSPKMPTIGAVGVDKLTELGIITEIEHESPIENTYIKSNSHIRPVNKEPIVR